MEPTITEVCNALTEYYGQTIGFIDDNYNTGFYNSTGYMIISLTKKGKIWFTQDVSWYTNDLPPYLMSLIGRFFEDYLLRNKK